MASWIDRRKNIINKIVRTLKKTKKEIDMNKFAILICAEHGCSERTAKNYIQTAKAICDHDIEPRRDANGSKN